MNAIVEMTLNQAMKVARAPTEHAVFFTEKERLNWNAARKVIVASNLCPSCACDGHQVKLGEWQEGDYNNYAGKSCPDCEEFIVCGEQPEYGDASDEWRGDADPGL